MTQGAWTQPKTKKPNVDRMYSSPAPLGHASSRGQLPRSTSPLPTHPPTKRTARWSSLQRPSPQRVAELCRSAAQLAGQQGAPRRLVARRVGPRPQFRRRRTHTASTPPRRRCGGWQATGGSMGACCAPTSFQASLFSSSLSHLLLACCAPPSNPLSRLVLQAHRESTR